MTGFSAADVIEPLKFDFKPYLDLEGVVPEPSDKQIDAFLRGMRQEIRLTFQEQGVPPEDADLISNEEFFKLLDKADDRSGEATLRRQAKMFAELCSGHPNQTQLMKLPPRVRLGFYNWLRKELFDPEAPAGAGTTQVRHLKSVAGD